MHRAARRRRKRADILAYYDVFNTTGVPPNTRNLTSIAIPIFSCPSRRPAQCYPLDASPTRNPLAFNAPDCSNNNNCLVVRGDYKINAGSLNNADDAGPSSFDPSSLATYPWSITAKTNNGISFQRSTIHISQITDGTSKTALVGEKYLNPDYYFNGTYTAEDQSLFSGYDNDNIGSPPIAKL